MHGCYLIILKFWFGVLGDLLTLKRLGHFFLNVISFSDAVHLMWNIFYMKLVQYNECLISIVDADGLVR